MKKNIAALVLFLLTLSRLNAQQAYPVTDKQPALVNGLEMGYSIKSEEVKKVGDKGDFSRYSVRFYVTNTTNEAKIILYKTGWNVLGNVSDQLVQFNCLNATGARFTTKSAVLSAPACNVLALVDDKDANNKAVQNKRFVQIGYWIQAGQTISTSAIVIVPLNEQPNVEAVYLVNLLQPAANASVGLAIPQPDYPQPRYSFGPPAIPGQGFAKIRNIRNNTYVNNQGGDVTISAIDKGWWSAQWQLVPIPGTNCYNIQNKWKQTYLTTDNGGIGLFVNYMSDGARWVLEPCEDGTVYRIRNLATGTYLCIAADQLKLAKNYNNMTTAEWALEQP